MKMIYVPIEPLEERYTESWYRNFPIEFKKLGFDVTVIEGEPLKDFVDVGTFLDINSTVHYKMTQLRTISMMFNNGEIEPNTVFFFGDIEFWGMESVRLMSTMNGVPVKIFAWLHAASYTKEDAFAVADSYQRYTELGWVRACDGVFVGSEYSKRAFIERRVLPQFQFQPSEFKQFSRRIHAIGNPLFLADYASNKDVEKRNQILLPNRFDVEKRPIVAVRMALAAREKYGYDIVITSSQPNIKSNTPGYIEYIRQLEQQGLLTIKDGLSKDEYHLELAKSKVMISTSIEESFGYCIAEALYYGCIPYLNNTSSHPEMVDCIDQMLFTLDVDLENVSEMDLNYNFDRNVSDINRLMERGNDYFNEMLVQRFTVVPTAMSDIMQNK